MEYNKLIAGMHTGDDVEGFYVLKDAFLKTTAAGKPFLSGVLADRSGTIELKVWDYSGPVGRPAPPGGHARAPQPPGRPADAHVQHAAAGRLPVGALCRDH